MTTTKRGNGKPGMKKGEGGREEQGRKAEGKVT